MGSVCAGGFLSLESIAAIANGLLTSPLSGAPYLGRRLIERVGPHRHPSLRVALALSLVTETGGPADYETGHVILGDVLKDDTASDPLRGMAAAALADSARLGRGMDADLEMAKDMYATALELGHRATRREPGSACLLTRSLEQSPLPVPPRHPASLRPFWRLPISWPLPSSQLPSSLPPCLWRASLRRLSACSQRRYPSLH